MDLILGAFFLFIGLWILLDWKIQSIMAWLPFVVIGGLLLFTTFLRCENPDFLPRSCARC